MRVRRGELALRHRPVGTGTVEEALRAVGEKLALDGADPRTTANGDHYVPRLKHFIASCRRQDPEPSRSWPANLTILRAGYIMAGEDPYLHQLADLATIAFFFLCRPGEYARAAHHEGRSSPFRLADITFFDPNGRRLPAATASLHDVSTAVQVQLTYTDQKNAVRGETVGHRRSGDTATCPVLALSRRVRYLRQFRQAADTPIYTVCSGPTAAITTKHVTDFLRSAAARVEHLTGIPADKIQAYSLRSGGATALLCSGCDPLIVQLLGRWRSDAMLRYLRAMAQPVVQDAATQMLQHGEYTFGPRADASPDLLPQETPAAIRNLCVDLSQTTLGTPASH
jgi:hypothetical protein